MSTNVLSKIAAFIWGEPTPPPNVAEIRQRKNGKFILLDETNTVVGEYTRLGNARRAAANKGWVNVIERTDTFLVKA